MLYRVFQTTVSEFYVEAESRDEVDNILSSVYDYEQVLDRLEENGHTATEIEEYDDEVNEDAYWIVSVDEDGETIVIR